MWLSLGAVFAWYLPWPTLIALWSPGGMLVPYIRSESLQTLPIESMTVALPSTAIWLSWQWIAASATALGLLLFIARLIAHQRQLQAWRNYAVPASEVWRRTGIADTTVPLFVVDGLDNAFVSGYFRPRIWIGRSQVTSPALASILKHELMHARHHDNFILLFVTLTVDIFWWNPMVRLLGRQVRRNVELSCDVACKRLSPRYRDDLAHELLNRQYRILKSSLINPMAWTQRFNVYRIHQLAKDTTMKFRHLCILVLMLCTSIFFVSNIAMGQATTDEQQIVNHLTITTIEGDSKREAITEFIGEPEVKKLIRLAEKADVRLDTRMEGQYRRVIVIESADMDETRKVVAAFKNTAMERSMTGLVSGDSGASMLIQLGFEATGQIPYAVTLAPGDGQWSGVTVGDYLVRVRPDRARSGDQALVIFAAHISRLGEGSYELISSPRVTTEMGKEAVIQVGNTEDMFTLKLLPTPLL